MSTPIGVDVPDVTMQCVEVVDCCAAVGKDVPTVAALQVVGDAKHVKDG